MSLFARLNLRSAYTVEAKEAGRLVYREGNREFVFPIYDDDGCVVLVGVPSEQRIRVLFDWHSQPAAFSIVASRRILPRISAHFENRGVPIRVFSRPGEETSLFHPELFACRANAQDLLAEIGLEAYADYRSIEMLHEEYGLEVGGISERTAAERVAQLLQYTFPQWHYVEVCHEVDEGEPGWRVAVHMFPASFHENNGWADSTRG